MRCARVVEIGHDGGCMRIRLMSPFTKRLEFFYDVFSPVPLGSCEAASFPWSSKGKHANIGERSKEYLHEI
jgi:hypothetical protein